MSGLLVVQHTPSPGVREMLERVVEGARDPEISGVDVTVRPALVCSAAEFLEADGYLFGTTANFGYMSGALKHFFDTVYYPSLDAVRGRPFGLWVHGNNDTAGAASSVLKLTGGLGLEQVAAVLEVIGAPSAADREACHELGGTVAASLMA
ncbi:flavodoxin [Tsukamurella sp. 8F]|uniref:flavodoxin family protein n=1 Tax=unclassified Tsukamurella TaxID=2633480 RepID=UPI0023B8FFC9|nr:MULTISPECIES: flavodoxin [unclassified Tsukamurella]MDF0531440.1 flavodoxin [Tsukamurella sp. 8J]MDF0587497.1 flavodoxin [Tsukamurella sp. 8F]